MKIVWQFAALLTGLICLLSSAPPVSADAPGLQASPLEYKDALTPGHIKTGYVVVSNPGDSVVAVVSSVRGFRQLGKDGQLEFYDDPRLAIGIQIGLNNFELGPHEAIRVGFNVDPKKLPPGGVYAALFFRTIPPASSSTSSYFSESANVGTLLELTNGPVGPHVGEVSDARFKFWQFGQGLTGSLEYANTDHSSSPAGYQPKLTVQVLPWGEAPQLKTGLVLPGVTRHFEVFKPGAYFGLLPVIITDSDTHHQIVRWVFAITGFYQWLLLVLSIVLLLLLPARIRQQIRRRVTRN